MFSNPLIMLCKLKRYSRGVSRGDREQLLEYFPLILNVWTM